MARKPRIEVIAAVSDFVRDVAKTDRAAAMAFFLLDQGKTVTGVWRGQMIATDQRAIFGRFIGKGVFTIDGARELVEMDISTDYTGMRSTEVMQPWAAIDGGYIERRPGVGFDNRAREG